MVSLDEVGLQVTIYVNKLPAEEFTDEEPGAISDGFPEAIPRSHKWIQSMDDAQFAIRVAAKPGAFEKRILHGNRHAIRFHIDIDDKDDVEKETITRHRNYGMVTGVKSYSETQVATRNFQFTSISTVDDAGPRQVAEDTKRAERLGVIRVRAYLARYENAHKSASQKANDLALEMTGKAPIAEKALKGRAVSHGSGLSPAVFRETAAIYQIYRYVRPKVPIAIFYFKYRSKEALQQELVIPRPRSPSVTTYVNQLTEDEVRRLAHAYLVQNSENKKRAASVKDEPGEGTVSERPAKVLKTEGGRTTIVDLTEDD